MSVYNDNNASRMSYELGKFHDRMQGMTAPPEHHHREDSPEYQRELAAIREQNKEASNEMDKR